MTEKYFLEYLASKRMAAAVDKYRGPANEFYSLLMAAARFADTDNMIALGDAFPDVIDSFRRRYNAPGGALDEQEMDYIRKEYNNDRA